METSKETLVKIITQKIIEVINENNDKESIPIGVSNRHLHISKEDLELLFGKGYKLTKLKDLKQPGQYAAKEVVCIKGTKGQFDKVRILGPVRDKTQIEISISDGFKLGINPPVRESGKIEGTPGIEIIGPCANLIKDEGVIAALRHIHMTPDFANKIGVRDNQFVDVQVEGIRKVMLGNVLVRISKKYVLEMHLDTDEANACLLSNNDKVKIIL